MTKRSRVLAAARLRASGVCCVEDWGRRVADAVTVRGQAVHRARALTTRADRGDIRPLDPDAGALGRELDAVRRSRHGRADGAPTLHTAFSPPTTARRLAGERLREDMTVGRAADDRGTGLAKICREEDPSMQVVAGVFVGRAEAQRAAAALVSLGVPRDRITVLAPGDDAHRVPTDEGERPGIGAALGAVTGVAAGFPVGAAVTLLVPGVGAVIASGVIGAVLLGAGGAAVGASLEASLVTGLPRDELFFYEDALRGGHSVVVAVVEDEALAEAGRARLVGAGAESIDAARERWWIGLRGAEREQYVDGPPAFERDEALYRRGFEAALGAATRGRGWDDSRAALRARHGADCDTPAFRRGWERGQTYQHDLGSRPGLKKSA